MGTSILVAGGSGAVGRVVVEQLLDSDAQVRVLTRGRQPVVGAVQQAVGDVTTGAGLAEALDGVQTVVACLDPVGRLVQEAVRSGTRPHLVYISIVGVDRVPFGYYRRKLADEQLIADSGLDWTVLRATQFHDLVAAALRVLATPPVMLVPRGWSFQPIDVRDVGGRLAELARGAPAGRVPDIAGPQVLSVTELARRYLTAVRKRRPILSVPLPGRVARAYRDGGHLAPDRAVGTITFDEYLDEQLAAGTKPYADKIRTSLRLPHRKRG